MPHFDLDDEFLFLLIAAIVFSVVIAAWAGLSGLASTLTAEIVGAAKLAITGGASWFLKVAYDKYRDKGAVKTARSLVVQELKQALLTCDDKIEDWKSRMGNVGSGPVESVFEVLLYPNVSTFAFEAVADKAVKLEGQIREPVFKAYYDLIRRRDNSRRTIHARSFRQHGEEAIREIERIKGLIDAALDKLKS